jgi:hypothetical protein
MAIHAVANGNESDRLCQENFSDFFDFSQLFIQVPAKRLSNKKQSSEKSKLL